MRTKNPIAILLENGMEFSTLKNMSENQIKVLAERFKKKETNEITMVSSTDSTTQSKLQSEKKPYEVYEKTEKEITEKFESKSQQGLFWAKCNNSKGKEKTKWCKMAREFSDSTTKKDYKNMPEKKHPKKTVKRKKDTQKENYERFLENRIMEMIEKNINPRITKGDLKKNISERSEDIMLKNPKRNTMFSENQGMEMKGMMKRPIMKLSSMGGEMGENTKEKERTVTPGIKTPPKRRQNPHKDPNPGVKEKPKANLEKQKNEYFNMIKQALNV
jgi:hypothetical protein